MCYSPTVRDRWGEAPAACPCQERIRSVVALADRLDCSCHEVSTDSVHDVIEAAAPLLDPIFCPDHPVLMDDPDGDRMYANLLVGVMTGEAVATAVMDWVREGPAEHGSNAFDYLCQMHDALPAPAVTE